MKTLLILLTMAAFLGCTPDDCGCEGQFYNETTDTTIHKPTDCERTPPEGFVFVKCLTIDY